MKFCIVHNWMMVTIIFQNSYATPLIRLLIRVIRSLVTTYQIYLKCCIVTNWRMANTTKAFILQIWYATPINRLLYCNKISRFRGGGWKTAKSKCREKCIFSVTAKLKCRENFIFLNREILLKYLRNNHFFLSSKSFFSTTLLL